MTKRKLIVGGVVLLAAALMVVGLARSTDEAAAAPGLVTEDLTGALTAQDLANDLLGGGITISNVTFAGADVAAGRFSGGTGIVGFPSGIILSTGDIAGVVGPNTSGSSGSSNGTPGDSDLGALSGFTTNDAAVLEFDFIPSGSSVEFSYVFASEEYNEYVGSQFNDVFAFLVNGSNCATVNGDAVSINSINNGSHASMYIDNEAGSIDTEMDGLTTVLSCVAPVNAGQTNHIKLAIADASDSIYDANVFLAAGSFVVSPDLSPPEDLSPAATVAPPETGAGQAAQGGSSGWLVVALAAVGLAGAGGYVAMRLRRKGV